MLDHFKESKTYHIRSCKNVHYFKNFLNPHPNSLSLARNAKDFLQTESLYVFLTQLVFSDTYGSSYLLF